MAKKNYGDAYQQDRRKYAVAVDNGTTDAYWSNRRKSEAQQQAANRNRTVLASAFADKMQADWKRTAPIRDRQNRTRKATK